MRARKIDTLITLMRTDSILYKKETHQLIGCAIEVHNELGHGFHEKPYENALVLEFHNHLVTNNQCSSVLSVVEDQELYLSR